MLENVFILAHKLKVSVNHSKEDMADHSGSVMEIKKKKEREMEEGSEKDVARRTCSSDIFPLVPNDAIVGSTNQFTQS